MKVKNVIIKRFKMIITDLAKYEITNDPNEVAEIKRRIYSDMSKLEKELYKDWEFATPAVRKSLQ